MERLPLHTLRQGKRRRTNKDHQRNNRRLHAGTERIPGILFQIELIGMVRNGLILCCLLFIATACNEFQEAVRDAKKENTAPPVDNYIVLLDLSDRILFNNQQQVAKDITVVKTIQSLFRS